MIGQISLFEIIGTDDLDVDLNEITEEDMANMVGRALGLTFTRDEFSGYSAKIKNLTLWVGFSNYTIEDHRRFIAVHRHNKKTTAGGGGPCDSVREAVSWFRQKIEEECTS